MITGPVGRTIKDAVWAPRVWFWHKNPGEEPLPVVHFMFGEIECNISCSTINKKAHLLWFVVRNMRK